MSQPPTTDAPGPAGGDDHQPAASIAATGADAALDRNPRRLLSTATTKAIGADTPAAPPPKRTWRSLLSEGLTPREVGIACGLGVAIGISPFPGLHYLMALYFAWLWRLNAPLVLISANISFGPLLLVWYAAGIAIGREILTGDPLTRTWPSLHQSLVDAKGWYGEYLVLESYFWSWFIGTTVLMIVAGVVSGFAAYLIARSVKRGRETLTKRFHRSG
jgi:uncharacterized protein (DUF2062 family)